MRDLKLENSSIKQIPEFFKKYAELIGPVNLDYGGGKYNLATEFLEEKGKTNVVFDPFARSNQENELALELIKKCGLADSCTILNVLNVIEERQERLEVVQKALQLTKEDVYIQIHEGDRSGNGRATKSKTWQNNCKTEFYIQELTEFGYLCERLKCKKKNMFKVKKP